MMSALLRPLPGAARLQAVASRRGVIRGDELAAAAGAQAMVHAARNEAQALVDTARQEAGALTADAQRQARELLQKAERGIKRLRTQAAKEGETQAWRRFEAFSAEWRGRCEGYLRALEQQSMPVVAKAIALLADETPPPARVRQGLRELVAQLGPVPDATLWISEHDHAALPDGTLESPWPLRADASVPAGACRLVASHGEWESRFDGRLERVLAVFRPPAQQPAIDEKGGSDVHRLA